MPNRNVSHKRYKRILGRKISMPSEADAPARSKSSINLWKNGVSKVVNINRSLARATKSREEPVHKEGANARNNFRLVNNKASIMGENGSRLYMDGKKYLEKMFLGLAGESPPRRAVDKARHAYNFNARNLRPGDENVEDSRSASTAIACTTPQLFGTTQICVICGRPARAHVRYKEVDNPAAEKAKLSRTKIQSLEDKVSNQHRARILSVTRIGDLTRTSGPPQGGYEVLITGDGFVDHGPKSRWACFGSAYTKVDFISTYRLSCICPARQSIYGTVDVTVTLDGGISWLAAENGWTLGAVTFRWLC